MLAICFLFCFLPLFLVLSKKCKTTSVDSSSATLFLSPNVVVQELVCFRLSFIFGVDCTDAATSSSKYFSLPLSFLFCFTGMKEEKGRYKNKVLLEPLLFLLSSTTDYYLLAGVGEFVGRAKGGGSSSIRVGGSHLSKLGIRFVVLQ